jgi:flagellum-specific peptidoglycan hydrolase FlgJ
MKKLLLFFILIFLSSCSSFRPLSESNLSVDDQINLYIKKYAPAATKNMRFYKIPASITLAQGILESGHGQSTLAKKANNHFGIKCHKGWKGKSILHDDDAKDECFRSYKNPLRSYKDHSLFLVERDRYSSLFKLNRKDYKSWAIGLKAAGYATDPKYADKLISLIERFRLNRFDE